MQPITTEVDTNIIETKTQTNENFVLDMDSLGLAQQYGFHTEVIDSTSDYKVTKSGENGVYQHISSNDLYGFLYTLPIDPYKPIFNKDALSARTKLGSTIGLQIFPISGYR